ncbi:HNH endonuclease signature motif containing protein [Pseudochrobactrum sp. XF203]|uniref:HNH endonuclease signature motif containing protein n=1 Tax=Pseudochrobactrum sp. XF203 TaxID=2879116 RepID=UPI001CE364BA|nr:HNH endonuclease [Pseudochrobactrum sp. XF203]
MRESGGVRTHALHHIKHWSVYKCHNAEDMIAICPACHDRAHFGPLTISDDPLGKWKAICRGDRTQRSFLYVEPGQKIVYFWEVSNLKVMQIV